MQKAMSKPQSIKQFMGDLPKNIFSGFVVSLIALPLGLGLALASEAPPIAGIIAAIVGGMVVSIIGGSHLTITGPGNGLVIVILSAIVGLGEGDLYQGYLYTLAAIIILTEGVNWTTQSIFGRRGYSIGHYARVVRADLLIMNAEENLGFFDRLFTHDIEHILAELPTDVLIVNAKSHE